MAEHFTKDSFSTSVLGSDIPVLVDFYADWCGPCKALAPVIDELTPEFAGKVKIGKINVDHEQELAGQFGVRSIPTMVLFKAGKEVDRITGSRSRPELVEYLNRALAA